MMEHLEFLTRGWTPGAVGIWIILGSLLLGMWKGLPAVLDAWSNSVGKEREHREREIARLEAQISASDKRHADCMEGQAELRREITAMQKNHASEIADLQKIISGLIIQMRQMQLSAASGAPMTANIPEGLKGLLAAIEDKGNTQ